jgi:patatin-like phospholipase/acyl hydrolase
MAKLIRILAIDGGGVRGIIPAQVLVKLENLLQEYSHNKDARIADYFDLVAGTSTGGILTCIYLCPDTRVTEGPLRPRFSAQDAVDFYLKKAPKIFKAPVWYQFCSLFGWISEKYPAYQLEQYLHTYFHDIKLNQLLKPCLITSYNIEKHYAHFFTQHDAKDHPDYNFMIKDVARATSAAPSYFPAVAIRSLEQEIFPLVDGAMVANNPTFCAYTEVCKEFADHPTAKDMLILSLGTGTDERPILYRKAKRWGKFGWAGPITNVLMSGNTDIADYELRTIFTAIKKPQQYLRINPKLPKDRSKIDNAKPDNLKSLLNYGNRMAETYQIQLERLAKLLIASQSFQKEEQGYGS